jgi:hypothetical protein
MRPLYIVVEELWSISSKPNERRCLSTSERPLFSGGTKRLAYAHARELASKFQLYGVHDEDEQIYWWGRNEIDSVNRRFVIEPARLFVDNDRPLGRLSPTALPIPPSADVPVHDSTNANQWRGRRQGNCRDVLAILVARPSRANPATGRCSPRCAAPRRPLSLVR